MKSLIASILLFQAGCSLDGQTSTDSKCDIGTAYYYEVPQIVHSRAWEVADDDRGESEGSEVAIDRRQH